MRFLFRLEYIGLQHLKWLILTGIIKAQVNNKSVTNCKSSRCYACEFIKGFHIHNKTKMRNNIPMKEKDTKKDHLLPGQMLY